MLLIICKIEILQGSDDFSASLIGFYFFSGVKKIYPDGSENSIQKRNVVQITFFVFFLSYRIRNTKIKFTDPGGKDPDP